MNKAQKEKIDKEKKTIRSFKASFEQGLNKDGETVYLKLKFNEALINYIKEYIINEKIKSDFSVGYLDGRTKRHEENRYLVKGFIYRNLEGDNRQGLFLCELLDTGKTTINFYSNEYLTRFKENFKDNFRLLIEVTSGLELKQEIIFKAQ